MILSANELCFFSIGIRLSQLRMIAQWDPNQKQQVLGAARRLSSSLEDLQAVGTLRSALLPISIKALHSMLRQLAGLGDGELWCCDLLQGLLELIQTIEETTIEAAREDPTSRCADLFLLGSQLPQGEDEPISRPHPISATVLPAQDIAAFQPGGARTYPPIAFPSITERAWTANNQIQIEQLLEKLRLHLDAVFPPMAGSESHWDWIDSLGVELQSWRRIELGLTQLKSEGTERPLPARYRDHATFDRDCWIHRRYAIDGASLKEVQTELKEHATWTCLYSAQGVWRAIERYCERTRTPKPRRRKVGPQRNED